MLVRYDSLNAGAWFKHVDYWGKVGLHCRSSLGKTLTFDLGGNFRTDSFSFRGDEMVQPVVVQVKLLAE